MIEESNRLKEKGNDYFKKGKYQAAIGYYTQAIDTSPEVSIYYTNRALAFMKIEDWDRVVEDCHIAIEKDNNNIKAYVLIAIAYRNKNKYDFSINYLEKGVKIINTDINKDNKYLKKDILIEIKRTKKKKWLYTNNNNNKIFTTNIMPKLVQIIKNARKNELEKNETEKDETEINENNDNHESRQINEQYDNINTFLQKISYEQEEENLDIPSEFCCPMSMEIMTDPVVTPSGTSYEREWIEKHLKTNGNTDPLTRKPLTTAMLYPNVNLRQVIENYLEKNPWAFEH